MFPIDANYFYRWKYLAERVVFLEARGRRALRFWNYDGLNKIMDGMGVALEEVQSSSLRKGS
jgi:very-short-patch-repair endonuclease